MTLPSPFTLPRSEFNAFLFASIGKESNGMPLTVVSALARLEMDPWQEASRLASLPRELAAPALDRLISQLPAGSWDQSETRVIAARLIELLPRGALRARPADRPPARRRKAIAAVILWLLVAGTAALLLLGHAIAAPAADAVQAVPQTLEFDIAREGAVVGHHRISFQQDGDRLVVHSELKIELAVLFVIVYRYQQTREEVWRNGKLIALVARTDDDGTPHDIKGHAEPNGAIRMTSGKDRWTLPPESVPASYWNESMVTQKGGPLVDSLTGRILPQRVVKLGQETVRAGGRDIVATHYRLQGRRARDIWYDASGRWVKMRAVGRDGSVAEWVLK